jgi:hypothetical protein
MGLKSEAAVVTGVDLDVDNDDVLTPVRTWVVSTLTQLFPSSGKVIRSKDGTEFQNWTGMAQDDLDKAWAAQKDAQAQVADLKKAGKPIPKDLAVKAAATLTSCNGFLGVVAGKVRIAGGLSPAKSFLSFNLPAEGRTSWHYYPDPDLSPKPGDFFQLGSKGKTGVWTFQHVGIILDMDYEGCSWTKVEAGMGGPSIGMDLIKRDGPSLFPPDNFMGWIDVDAYYAGWSQVASP